MGVQSIPSVDPANNGTLTGMLKEVLGKFLQNMDDMLPARVISYDRTTGRAQVQPLVMMVTTQGAPISRAPVASIPVLHLGAGGFLLDFPIKPGDLGWIKANDRDISLFEQLFKEIKPNTYRKHSFEDAVFIPDAMKGYTIQSEDADNVVLQSLDGTQRLAIWSDRVKLTSGSSSFTVENSQVIIDTPLLTITGQVNGTGARGTGANITGTVHATVDVTAQTVSLHGHVHINGGGIGDSGPPAT